MYRHPDIAFRYAALTLPFVLGAALRCRWSLWTALAITVVQALHLHALRRSNRRGTIARPFVRRAFVEHDPRIPAHCSMN